ncbi:MAG: hypothetical protein IIY58_06160 [Aeriscardovia sp.]|nr:hypothetical protein [Aeriscardovia sp.]
MNLTKEQCEEIQLLDYSKVYDPDGDYIILRLEPIGALGSLAPYEEEDEFAISYGKDGLDDFITLVKVDMRDDLYIELDEMAKEVLKNRLDSQMKEIFGLSMDEAIDRPI